MAFTEQANSIFLQAIRDYHLKDNVDTPISNPYDLGSIEHSLYLKCWIDTVQWHLEDIIRAPHIDPVEALALKRRIDRSNQDRTDLVEEIDSYFRQSVQPGAGVARRPSEHREPCLGGRPSEHPGLEDMAHA